MSTVAETPRHAETATPWPMLALIVAVTLNIQSQIFAVGPLLPRIVDDLALSGSVAGLVAGVPTLMMGLGALPGGRLADRLGAGWSLAAGLAVAAVAGGLRGLAPGAPSLLALTVAMGAGIGLALPGMPAYFRQRLPDLISTATGAYTLGLVLGAIVTTGLTGPLLVPRFGWRGALVFWAAAAGVATVLWLLGTRPWRTGRPVAAPAAARSAAAWSPWRDRTVRVAAGVYAAQGLVYFLLVLWLPAVYLDAGLSDAAAGARLAVLTGASLPGTVLFPAWIRRDGSTRAPLLAATAMTFAGALGFALATTAPTLEWLWPALAGLGVCGMLVAAVVDTANAAPTSRTGDAAGAVLAVGYVLTALGPLLAGVVRDRTGTYSSAMLILPVITAAALLLAFLSPNLPSVRAVEEGEPAP